MSPSLTRRRLLFAGSACTVAAPAGAASPRSGGRPIAIGQPFDASGAEQDVSKDFLVGARAAWQDINGRGGIHGRPVQLLALETDGSAGSARQAVGALLANESCMALCGTVGDPIARAVALQLRREGGAIAHAAPWLQDSATEVDDQTFPIFAGRQEQVAHALRSLSAMGVQEVGAVFASARDEQLHQRDVAASAAALKLRLSTLRGDGDLVRLGSRLGAGTPAVLLFLGGTPELAQFTQGLGRQTRQRYVVALADVNLQTVQQMGGGRHTPVIATQAVPVVTAPLPVVRRYREVLARLFDEPPAPLSLAGFLAARYAYQVLAAIEGPLTRASALAAFQRRTDLDLGGYRVRFDENGRGSAFVTQSMLTADGRVVG